MPESMTQSTGVLSRKEEEEEEEDIEMAELIDHQWYRTMKEKMEATIKEEMKSDVTNTVQQEVNQKREQLLQAMQSRHTSEPRDTDHSSFSLEPLRLPSRTSPESEDDTLLLSQLSRLAATRSPRRLVTIDDLDQNIQQHDNGWCSQSANSPGDIQDGHNDVVGSGNSSRLSSAPRVLSVSRDQHFKRSNDSVRIVAPYTTPDKNRDYVRYYEFCTLNDIAPHEYRMALAISDSVQSQFVDGTPLHMLPSATNGHVDELGLDVTSSIFVVGYPKFICMAASDLQDIFGQRHILVHGHPTFGDISWSPNGLLKLSPWDKKVVVQDLSCRTMSKPLDQQKMMSLKTLYQESLKGDKGWVLNALDLPLGCMGLSHVARFQDLASHQFVWQHTAERDEMIPDHDISWGIASCHDSMSWVHLDTDGLATVVQSLVGKKVWSLGQPKQGTASLTFDDGDASWLETQFDPHSACTELWDYESVELTINDVLFMWPNTPHWVVTTDHCILVGCHFYASSCVQSSCWGVVHNFFMGQSITNTSHPKLWTLLRRMMEFWVDILQDDDPKGHPQGEHVPDPSDLSGLQSYLAVGCMIVFAEALDYRTYERHRTNQTLTDKVDNAKKAFVSFMRYFASWYCIHGYDDYGLFWEALVHFATIVHQYAISSYSPPPSLFQIRPALVTAQLSNALKSFWGRDAAEEFDLRVSAITGPFNGEEDYHFMVAFPLDLEIETYMTPCTPPVLPVSFAFTM
ncbi:hypothetical protein JAAARDRAFT_62160 [Jaapia argillacea MUCL 33604]|uniref:JmjC domain-containing protein n=1 Tax=Jaapia argillacea MUCL 33604 TaxID=933084 RepID=A0A067PAS4_9AGAM|nr:hypothetical protein JAAARDRAFT_62160 [Jaapia argillacea MUCL 33604]